MKWIQMRIFLRMIWEIVSTFVGGVLSAWMMASFTGSASEKASRAVVGFTTWIILSFMWLFAGIMADLEQRRK